MQKVYKSFHEYQDLQEVPNKKKSPGADLAFTGDKNGIDHEGW